MHNVASLAILEYSDVSKFTKKIYKNKFVLTFLEHWTLTQLLPHSCQVHNDITARIWRLCFETRANGRLVNILRYIERLSRLRWMIFFHLTFVPQATMDESKHEILISNEWFIGGKLTCRVHLESSLNYSDPKVKSFCLDLWCTYKQTFTKSLWINRINHPKREGKATRQPKINLVRLKNTN